MKTSGLWILMLLVVLQPMRGLTTECTPRGFTRLTSPYGEFATSRLSQLLAGKLRLDSQNLVLFIARMEGLEKTLKMGLHDHITEYHGASYDEKAAEFLKILDQVIYFVFLKRTSELTRLLDKIALEDSQLHGMLRQLVRDLQLSIQEHGWHPVSPQGRVRAAYQKFVDRRSTPPDTQEAERELARVITKRLNESVWGATSTDWWFAMEDELDRMMARRISAIAPHLQFGRRNAALWVWLPMYSLMFLMVCVRDSTGMKESTAVIFALTAVLSYIARIFINRKMKLNGAWRPEGLTDEQVERVIDETLPKETPPVVTAAGK